MRARWLVKEGLGFRSETPLSKVMYFLHLLNQVTQLHPEERIISLSVMAEMDLWEPLTLALQPDKTSSDHHSGGFFLQTLLGFGSAPGNTAVRVS